MVRPAAFLPILLLAGCGDPAPPPPQQEGRPVTSLAEIAGEWDIERFGDYTPSRLEGGLRRAFVDVGADRLSYAIECNYSGIPAEMDGQGLLHSRRTDGLHTSTAMGCGPEGEARESAFFGFFSTRPRVTWAHGGRIRMSNGRTELLLQRPDARRLAFAPTQSELAGRWVPQMGMRTLGGNGHEGWGFQERQVLTFTAGTIRYTGCTGATFTYRLTPDARLDTLDETGTPQCGQDSPSSILLRILRADPQVEKSGEGGLALTAGNHVVFLFSEAELSRREQNPPGPPPGTTPPPPPPPPPRPER